MMDDPILNVIAAIICVIGAILIAIRWIRIICTYTKASKEASLNFEREECYSLCNKDFDRLNVNIVYDGKDVKNRFVLFKGIIKNSGKSDIDITKRHRPLQIKTDNNYRWRAVSITEKPNKSDVSFKIIDKRIIEFDLDFLKTNEQIKFEVIAKIPKHITMNDIDDDFCKSIGFDIQIME